MAVLRGRGHVPAIAVRARERLVGAGTGMPAAHRIVLFVAVLSAAATALFALVLTNRTAPFASVVLPWPLLAAGFCIAEMKVVSVHFRRETHSFSLSEFPAVIGLFFLSPVDYLLALLVGSAVALIVAEHQAPAKLAFNLSNFALTGVVSLAVFHRIVTGDPNLDPVDWVAAFTASLAATVVGALTTATVITISGGARQYEKLPEMLQFGGIVAIANTSLALLAVSLFLVNPMTLILLAVPLADAIIALGRTLNLRVVAEGIEQEWQLERLRGLGCEFGQGFYFARPTDAAGFEAYVAARHPSQAGNARIIAPTAGRLVEPVA